MWVWKDEESDEPLETGEFEPYDLRKGPKALPHNDSALFLLMFADKVGNHEPIPDALLDYVRFGVERWLGMSQAEGKTFYRGKPLKPWPTYKGKKLFREDVLKEAEAFAGGLSLSDAVQQYFDRAKKGVLYPSNVDEKTVGEAIKAVAESMKRK